MCNVPFVSARLPECHRNRVGNGLNYNDEEMEYEVWEEREREEMLVS